jgi:hypothetical protein
MLFNHDSVVRHDPAPNGQRPDQFETAVPPTRPAKRRDQHRTAEMAGMAAASVHCIATSPPYWGLGRTSEART